IARYDAAGNQTWITRFGQERLIMVRAIALDDQGEMIFAGTAIGLNGDMNAFVARYRGPGNPAEIVKFGSGATDSVNGIVVGTAGHLLLSGRTDGDLGGTHMGGVDFFLVELSY